MKKSFKSILASLLAVIMLLAPVTAFADEIFEDDFYELISVTESGYYLCDNGIYQDGSEIYNISCTYKDSNLRLYYLNEGNEYSVKNGKDVDLIGKAVTSVTASDPTSFNSLILGVDADEGALVYNLNAPSTVIFDNGETVTLPSTPFFCDAGIEAGENTVKYGIPAYDGKNRIITACYIEEVIKSVELKNSYDATAYLDYKGNVFFDNLNDTAIIINGNQEIVVNKYGYFVYSSRNYPITIGSEIIEGSPVKIKIYISGNADKVEIASFNCTVRDASYTQNLDRCKKYFEEELYGIVDGLLDKYSSWPSYLNSIKTSIMYAEYMAKAVPLLFEYLSDIYNLYNDAVSDLLYFYF